MRTALHPDLQSYLVGNTLRHPLLSAEWVDSRMFARLNRLYELCKQSTTSGKHERNDWELLRPDLAPFDRLRWFDEYRSFWDYPVEYRDRVAEYDRLVGQIWTDPELLWHTSDAFQSLLVRALPGSPIDALMIESEFKRLAELPEILQVFRGHVCTLDGGVSWTLNPNVALDWACRNEPAHQPGS